MSYTAALDKAWHDLSAAAHTRRQSVAFLADTYDIDIEKRAVLSASCNAPAKDYTAIILLHYLTQKLAFGRLPEPAGEWIDFNQLEGGEAHVRNCLLGRGFPVGVAPPLQRELDIAPDRLPREDLVLFLKDHDAPGVRLPHGPPVHSDFSPVDVQERGADPRERGLAAS